MLIGLNGRKGAGKDTIFERLHLQEDARRVSLADKLYESAAAALGVEVEVLQRAKRQPRASLQLTLERPDGVPYIRADISVRWFLELYGAEAHRDIFGKNFWLEQVNLDNHMGMVVVVTDVRFPNDAEFLRERGAYIVQVTGPPEVEDPEPTHASDMRLPEELVDWEIDNSVRCDNFHKLDRQLYELVQEMRSGSNA